MSFSLILFNDNMFLSAFIHINRVWLYSKQANNIRRKMKKKITALKWSFSEENETKHKYEYFYVKSHPNAMERLWKTHEHKKENERKYESFILMKKATF